MRFKPLKGTGLRVWGIASELMMMILLRMMMIVIIIIIIAVSIIH